MKQLIAEAKAGKAMTYGTPGAGSPMHIVGEMLNKDAGISLAHVPYRGVAPVVTDVLGGHVTIGWITPGAVAAHVNGGKLVAAGGGRASAHEAAAQRADADRARLQGTSTSAPGWGSSGPRACRRRSCARSTRT